MVDEKKIDDADLAEISGAGGVISHLEQDGGTTEPGDGNDITQPPSAGGSPDPEGAGGGGGNQDLGI